jgi:hypothetical protein
VSPAKRPVPAHFFDHRWHDSSGIDDDKSHFFVDIIFVKHLANALCQISRVRRLSQRPMFKAEIAYLCLFEQWTFSPMYRLRDASVHSSTTRTMLAKRINSPFKALATSSLARRRIWRSLFRPVFTCIIDFNRDASTNVNGRLSSNTKRRVSDSSRMGTGLFDDIVGRDRSHSSLCFGITCLLIFPTGPEARNHFP